MDRRMLALACLVLAGCVSYRPTSIAPPGSVWKGEGLEVRVDSVTCCARYVKGKFVEALLSIRNDRDRPFRLAADEVTLVDTRGATVSAAAARIRVPRTWMAKPEEITEFERRFETRLSTVTVIESGAMVQVRVFFPGEVDFDRLSVIRVSGAVARPVEIPLRALPPEHR